MKFPSLPRISFQTTQRIILFSAIFCIISSFLAGPNWISMIDTTIGGYLIAHWLWMGRLDHLQENFDRLATVIDHLIEINHQLAAEHEMIIMRDENDGKRPTLN